MKKIVFLFSSIVMLSLSGCFDKGGNITSYPPMGAIVDFYTDFFQPMIITSSGTYYAPELISAMGDLYDGDAIWTVFSINYDQQPSLANYYTVSEMQKVKVDKDFPRSTPESEDFDVPIENMNIVDRVVYEGGDIFFFGFQQTAPTDQRFIYEMTYDPNDSDDPPAVYLKAKKEGKGSESSKTYNYPYAFNMRHYFASLPKDSNKKVKFKIKYYTGEGENPYKEFVDQYGRSTLEIEVE